MVMDQTVGSDGMLFFIPCAGWQAGRVEDHSHGSGAGMKLKITLGGIAESSGGSQTLTLLAEELGYANYGFKGELFKGIHGGAVEVDGQGLAGPWKMRGGLAGEHLDVMSAAGSGKVAWAKADRGDVKPGTWLQTSFATPKEAGDGANSTQLFLHVTGLARGRFWLNGVDVGRYWTLTRNNVSGSP